MVKRLSSAIRTWTGSTKTRLPIFTEGKYPFCFQLLKARIEGRVSGSGKTSTRPVFIPTSCGSVSGAVFTVAVLLAVIYS